ncbi:hypothetical protein PV341_44275 [Streptomyces sp. PA03-1a]|nr:hypothetical protein [Streptomyces sp. PA03-1a]
MNIETLTDKLGASGLLVLDGEPLLTTCPPEAASQASACGPEHGRVDEVIDLKRRDGLRDVNAAWYRLATRFGLFGERGEFLTFVNLGEDDEIDFRWLQVMSLFRFDGHQWCGGQAACAVSYSAGLR